MVTFNENGDVLDVSLWKEKTIHGLTLKPGTSIYTENGSICGGKISSDHRFGGMDLKANTIFVFEGDEISAGLVAGQTIDEILFSEKDSLQRSADGKTWSIKLSTNTRILNIDFRANDRLFIGQDGKFCGANIESDLTIGQIVFSGDTSIFFSDKAPGDRKKVKGTLAKDFAIGETIIKAGSIFEFSFE